MSESSGLHVDCPLCLSSILSGKQFERHVGRHLEELALFALPRYEEDDEEEAAISSDENSDMSHHLTAEVSYDEEMKTTSKQHLLGAEDTIDLPDYDNSRSDHGLSSEASEDRSITKKETRPQDILEPYPDPESAKEDNLPKEINLEMHESTISPADMPNSGRRSSKDHSLQINEDGIGYTTDYIEDLTLTQPIHWDRRWDVDENGPDIILIRNNGNIYPLHFRANAIDEGALTVGALRLEAAKVVGAAFSGFVELLYKGNPLKDHSQTCKAKGIQQHSEVLCIVVDTDPSRIRDSSDYERGHESHPPQAQSKIMVNKNKETKQSSPVRDETEPVSMPFLASRHTSSAPPSSSLPIPPVLETLPTAMEQVSALTVWAERVIIPLCDKYAAHPPADIKKRDFEHKKLTETIVVVMIKADGIESDGDMTARNARKALIKQLEHASSRLDEAAIV
ncbi:hypothetical protein N7517_003475 [Penicillium concentricum]|uniref:BAG domain-containing protein n=1 Tax=Penicillium concentricum TaxID=293559 RepID=A0A9X0B296_9EURO|nr:uncharacterized protein N7517_003475 [Penicillium concentricum]KAJ5385564.1 hypothetical protein N7517_003475 [Penicillium concentricum]